MNSHSSNTVGPELLKLLGVPAENCVRATINLEAGKEVTVTAEYLADMETEPDTNKAELEVRKFDLVERER